MIAFVFPGQASQAVGMGRDLVEDFPACRKTFEEADEALGFPLSRSCFEGPADQLELTAIAQPAILTMSVAIDRILASEGIRPDVVAGHSLGEYSALVAARSLAFRDALRLVRQRGLYMQEAVPVGQGAMAAIMGLDERMIASICREVAGDEIVTAANLNAPGQTVLSGHVGAVDRAIDRARERGARRAIKLKVSAPFHCSLMEAAARRLESDLARTPFNDLDVPLVSNVTAQVLRKGNEARAALLRQVTAPVLWEKSVRTLVSMGVRRGFEVGPGEVLTGLMKRTDRSIRCIPLGTVQAVSSLLQRVS
ncbi:MAG: ACP S-malonyltransferase [Acidobacteriota bacterium]